ncbi:MAG: hypothetical protein CM1200mP39_07280 [Dehalococcoidia bacterium]|nr:MAG: hypothetical protein CM1200mP39_07280 [Dehalococcoidia bacterium]
MGIKKQLGPIEIIVNNASVFDKLGLEEVSAQELDRHFAINVKAPFLLAKSMNEQLTTGSAGKIINLNDWRKARPTRLAYGVTKSALTGLTRTLALSLAPNIQVNEIAFGAYCHPQIYPWVDHVRISA